MGDYTELTYANAFAVIQYDIGGVTMTALVWIPTNPAGGGPVSGYRAPTAGGADGYSVSFFEQGGAGVNSRAQDLGSNATALMLANNGSVIVSYDTRPLGFYLPKASDPRAVYGADAFADGAAIIIHCRNHCADPAYFGVGGRISVLPQRTLAWGLSKGGRGVLRTQLHRDGDFDYIADAYAQGESRFARRHSHCAGFVLANQPQVMRASMPLSKFTSEVQTRSDDEDPLSTYVLDGAHLASDTTLLVKSDTARVIRGQRLQIAHTPITVVGCTGNGVSPIVLTISGTVPAGIVAGKSLTVASVGGNTLANGTKTVQAVTSNTITVNGTGNGTYTSGGTVSWSYVYSLATDYAGGAGTLDIEPSLQGPVADATLIDFVATGQEKYGATNQVWGQYDYPSNSGYIWLDSIDVDDPDAVFPWERKRANDVDVLISADNPRVAAVTWILLGSSANDRITSDLTGEKSFLAHTYAPIGTLADGDVDPSNDNLHGEVHILAFAESVRAARGASTFDADPNVLCAVGNKVSNPDANLASSGGRAWNLGQAADFTSVDPSIGTGFGDPEVSLKAILDAGGFFE